MRKSSLLLAVLLILAACNSAPATVVVLVVTATPAPGTATSIATAPAQAIPATTIAPTASALPPSPAATSTPITNNPQPLTTTLPAPGGLITTATFVSQAVTFGPTQTLSAFPTDTRQDLYIAHEDFQHGFMFWISSIKKIWVCYASDGSLNSGTWEQFDDSFQDGEPEFDPNLTPPAEATNGTSQPLFQPHRGFGKLWRTNKDVQDKLGWATTPEFAVTTTYVYQPGGYLTADGQYVAEPGRHLLTTYSREIFVFNESDHTWQRK